MRLRKHRVIVGGLAFMAVAAFWQMYDNIVPLILKNSFHLNEVWTGVIMAADNVLALVLLPVFGMMSDKTDTRIGKRMPYIIAGTVLSCICMCLMPFFDNHRNLIMFLVMTGLVLIFMGVFRSPSVAITPDITPRPKRSAANAIVNMMGAFGAIFALATTPILVAKGTTPDYSLMFYSMATFMMICLVVMVIFMKENKWSKIAHEENLQLVKEGVLDSIEEEEDDSNKGVKLSGGRLRSLIFMLLSVAFWYIAYNGVTTAFSRYAMEVWDMDGGGYTSCLMVATVAAVISYIPVGIIASNIGRKKCIMFGIIMIALGFGFVGIWPSFSWIVNIGFVIIGIGWGSINVNSFPMVVEIASDGDVGKYTGYYYTFSMAAQVLTPVMSGALLQYVSYRTLFPYAVAFSVLAFITMIFVRHGDVIPSKKKSILEHLDVDD